MKKVPVKDHKLASSMVRLSKDEMKMVDAARGEKSRAVWLRESAMARVFMETNEVDIKVHSPSKAFAALISQVGVWKALAMALNEEVPLRREDEKKATPRSASAS